MSYNAGQAPQGYPPQEKAPHVQQPQATQAMDPHGGPGGNRNSKNLPIGPSGRPWSNDLCDCFGDAGTFLLSYFCPCIVYGHNKQRYEHLKNNGVADPNHGGEIFSGDCCLHGCLLHFGCAWILQMGLRSSIRGRYQIEGGTCGDCCTSCFCVPCQLTQESRELELEERSLGGTWGGMIRQA